MKERASGATGKLLTYFQENSGRLITAAELEQAFPAWDRKQIMSNMYSLLLKPYASTIEKLEQGIWRYVDKSEPGNRNMVIEVLKEKETYLVVEDVEDGKIYKMTLVG
jgi:hypothetical protein